jgi:metallopeptidase family M12-like protein
MSTAARSHLSSVLLLLLLGCSGDPSGPGGSGTLAVSIQGLPGGSAASVTVSGPDGYTQSPTSSQTFTGLTSGVYTVTATGVTVGTAQYQPAPASQTLAVVRNGSPAMAHITYTTPSGDLALTISGLGTSQDADVTVTGPGGYSNQSVTSSTTLTGLVPGTYTIDAQDVTASCSSTFAASPPTQDIDVAPSATANATVAYSPTSGGLVNLCIDGMYLTQSAQNYDGTVPLVQGRDGYLRIFPVADKANTATPAVEVRFYSGASLQSTVTLPPPLGLTGVPTAPDESALAKSWNYAVPGTMIQPGLRIEATVNPGGVGESNPSDNVFAPAAPSIRTVPTLNVTFVPVSQKGIPIGRRVPGNVTNANKDQFLASTNSMHPIGTYNALVHAVYTTTTTDTLQSDNSNNGWTTILSEIDALRVLEGSSRYYYGVAKVSYSSGVAGVAYVSNPQVARAAIGWDYLQSGSVVAAHELGHNWGRNHAPCGGPSGVDPSYPHPDGTTGGYGYDVSAGTLKPPTSTDIMGYCDPKWISEYTYSAVMNYLGPVGPVVQGSGVSAAVQPCLVVWGHIRNGELVLEPAFQVNTRPNLPTRAGPYSLEGRDSTGNPVFSLSFAPNEIADAPGNQQNFVFAVPLAAERASRLANLHLSGRGRPAVLAAATAMPGAPAGVQSEAVEVRRAQAGSVALRWDARAHPMIMVRDTETGEVLSLARGGDARLSTLKGQVDLVISDGVKSRVKRVTVAR